MEDHNLVFDEDACNSARFTSEITSLTYSPTTNCLVALVKEHIQIIDASTGILLRSTPPIDHHLPSSDEPSPTTLVPPSLAPSRLQHCTIHPKVDKLVVVGHKMVGARKHANGAYLLHTILDTPIRIETEEVTIEMELSWGQTVLTCLQELRASNTDLLPDDMDRVIEQLTKDTQRAKKIDGPSLKTSKWQVCIIRGPLTNLKRLFDEVISLLTANEKTKNTSTIPILSLLRYRLALMSTEFADDFKIDVTLFNSKWRQIMHVEALRLQTFSQWPHKNYKWATPEAMAGAGFYYEPTGSDRAICFQCGVCLLYWEPTDEPWSEHERHSTCCPYVMGRFTENVPLLISDATSHAQQHFSTQLISCWSSVHESNFWGTGSHDGVVTMWDLQHGFAPLRLLQVGQYDSNKVDKHRIGWLESNFFVEITEQLSHPEVEFVVSPTPAGTVPSPPPNMPEIAGDKSAVTPKKTPEKSAEITAKPNDTTIKSALEKALIPYKPMATLDNQTMIPIPADTTKPADDNAKPADATPKPADTTPKPADTTSKPTDTAPKPADTTPKPADTAPKPADANAKPADTTPKPADTAPKPADITPKPADANAKPADTTPKPADITPKPADANAKPADTTPKPADITPKPTDTTVKPAETVESAATPIPTENSVATPDMSNDTKEETADKPPEMTDKPTTPLDKTTTTNESASLTINGTDAIPQNPNPSADDSVNSDELTPVSTTPENIVETMPSVTLNVVDGNSSAGVHKVNTVSNSNAIPTETTPDKQLTVELANFKGELTAICLAAIGEPEVLTTELANVKKSGASKSQEEVYEESQVPTYLISAMVGSEKDVNKILLQVHRVSKPLVPPNKMNVIPKHMNLSSDVSFDSDLDEEINDLLMLVPQGQQSTDDGGNDDLDDTTESNSSSIIQCDNEQVSALNPLHTQSLLLQVPAGLKECRVEQIIVQKGGNSLCLLLKWKRDDEKRATGGVLFYQLHSFNKSIFISSPISLTPFKDKINSFSRFTILPFENKLDTETLGYCNQEAEVDSSGSEDEMFIQTLFEEVEFPAEKYKWLNRSKGYFKKKYCFVAGINANGDVCVFDLMTLSPICKIERDSKDNPFTHITYCKGLDRIAAVSLDGVLRLYTPQGALFTLNSTSTEQAAITAGYEMDQEFLSSPLTFDKLRTLCNSYQGQIIENRPIMSPPTGWRDIKPEQQNRRNPLHVHQQAKKEQSRLCWQYKPSDGQKEAHNKPHLFELTLPHASPLSHIEVKFYLHNHIELPGDLLVSLLAPVSAKDASESKENKIDSGNDTMSIAGLKLRYLSGPIKIQACLDATGTSGIAYLASPQLLSIKGRSLFLVIHDSNMGETGEDIPILDGKDKPEEDKDKDKKDSKDDKQEKDKDSKDKKKEKEFPIETIYITVYQPSSSVTATHLLTLRSYVRDEKLQAALLKIAIRQPQEDEATVELDQLDDMQLYALDLCSWIAGMQAHDAAPIPNFPKVVSEYLKGLLESCLLRGTRETAHKCVRLIATLLKSEDSSDGPPSNHSNFLNCLSSALLSLLPTIALDVCFPVGVSWLFKLLNFLSLTYQSELTAPSLVDLLLLCLNKLSNQHEALHAVLCSKFDLYGAPLDPYIWDAPLPSLKYTAPPPKPPGSTNTAAPQVTYILDLASVKGITSYVHDDLSKMIQHTTGATSTSGTGTTPTTPSTPAVLAANKKLQVPVTPLPEYLAYSSMGLLDSQPLLLKFVPALKNCTCNIVDKEKDILSEMKNTGPDINTGIEVDSLQLSGGTDSGPADYIEHMIDRLTSVLSSLPPQPQIEISNFEDNEFISHTPVQFKLPTVYSNVHDLHRWLLLQPKQFMLTVDSVQSGAVYYATFELEHAVELSDFFIPPCEYMSSVAVDVWKDGDSDDPIRLGSTNDFSTKAFVLSNISPPPVCRFIKVSLGGKLGAGGALAKVNMGVFFGRPPLPAQYAKESLPVQIETLRLIRTEYQSHRSKLITLLQTIQHIDNGNIPSDAKLEIEQSYHKCSWFRLQMNRLRRMIERTCDTAHISLREDTTTESLLSPTHFKSSPLTRPPLIPDNYLNLIVECVVDTMLSGCFNSHAKGLDLNSNAPFARQDSILMGDDEDDEKDVYGELAFAAEEHASLLTLDRSLCESLFYKTCLVARPELLVKVSSLLITSSSSQPWWPEFIAGLLKNLFSIGMSRVVVKDRVFLIVSYMAEMSPGTSQIIECLSKILSDLLPVYTEGVQDELGFCMPAIADIQLLSWGLLLLLRLLEKYYTQPPTTKLKDTTSTSTTTQSTAASKSSKWDFILPGTNLEHPPTNKAAQSVAKPQGATGTPQSVDVATSDEEKKERHRISRIVTMHKQRVEELRLQYQSLYGEYQAMKEKMKEGESHPSVQTIYNRLKRIKHTAKKHYKDAMTLRFQRACLLVRKFERKLACVKAKLPASEQGEQEVDQSCFIPFEVCSPLAKSLIRLLLAMDSTYHLDLYLIACKILSKISLISIPTLSIYELFSKDQLNLLLTRALTNPENIVPLIPTPTKGSQWASHTLRCLFINILYSEFVTGPNRQKALSNHTKSTPPAIEGSQEFNSSSSSQTEGELAVVPFNNTEVPENVTLLHSTKQQHIQVIDKLMRRLHKIKGKAEKLGVKIEVPDEFESLVQRGSPASQTIKLTEQYSKVIDDRLSNTFDYFAETQLQLLAKEEAESLANALSEGTQAPSVNQTIVYPHRKLSLTEMQNSISKSGELIYETFSCLLAESSENPFTNFSLELFLELWVDMLDAISFNSSLNKEENEQVTYIAETLHMNKLIVQLLKYVVDAEALSSRAWWLLFKITYSTFIIPLEIKQEDMMLLVDVYLNFLTGKALLPMEGHHEELISDPTGTLSLVLETFSSVSQLNKCGDEIEIWHGVMFKVLFKLFSSRDRLSRLSQGEALTLMIKSLQADLKHPLKTKFISPSDLSDFAHNAVNYIAHVLNQSCPVYCRSDSANNSYWQKKINKIKFFPDAFSPIRLCSTLITFLQKLVLLYLDPYVDTADSSTKVSKVKNAPVEVNLEEFFALCLLDTTGETAGTIEQTGDSESHEQELEDQKSLEAKKRQQEQEATKQLSEKINSYVADKYKITQILTSNPDTIRLLLHILNRFGQLPEVYKNLAKEKKEKATAYTTETESTIFYLHSKVTQFMSTLISHTPVHMMDSLYAPLANFLKQNSQQSVHMPYLSDPLLEFASSLLSYQSCAEGFLNLGSLTPVMTGLMRSSKLCLNHSCGPLSDTITTLGGGSSQARVEEGTGLLHFSGKASIIVNDTNGLMCTGMLQNLLSQRAARCRNAVWNCQFRDYPKAWVTLYIYLPHPILLHAVQLNVQSTTYQYCPSYVAIDIARNLGCEPDIPVATPIRTSGLGTIRIELTHPEVVQALNIHLCKPRDFQSISLSTISLLGTSLYTDVAEIAADAKPLTEVYPPHASYPWIQMLCKLLITHSNLAPDIVRTSMQSANMLNTLVSFLTAPVSLSGLQQIEAILLTLAEHSKEIAMQLTHLLLHPNYFKLTNPPHYLDTSQGQPLSTITTSFMHLLFHLTVATNEVSIERLKTFIHYAKPRILAIEKHSECLPEMVHVLSTAVWTSKKIGMVSFINDLITKEDILGIIGIAQNPAISIGMKRAIDLLLCALCYAFPPYFTILLQRSEQVLLTSDTRQVLNFASLLGTLSCASQSLTSVQSLLDSAIPSQFCHRLQILFENLIDQNMGLLDKEGISLDDAPLILQFFSQIADDQSLMKDWIGSEEPRKFWLSLLEFLCLPAMATETLNIAVFRACQDAALNFFLSVSRHHVKNQRVVVEMLCNALRKAIVSVREGTHSSPKGSLLPPFVQSLVLHFILESEIVKIYLIPRKQGKIGEERSFISLGKFMPTLSYYIGNNLVKVTECNLEHPRYGCGHGRYLVYTRSSTTIGSFSNSFKIVPQYIQNDELPVTRLAAPSSPIKFSQQVDSTTEASLENVLSVLAENPNDIVLANIVSSSGLSNQAFPSDNGKPTKKKEPVIDTKKVNFFRNDTLKSMPIGSKSAILKIEKNKGKSSIDSSNHLHLFFEFGEGEKKTPDSNETVVPSQMELFASCGGLTLLAEYLPLIYPNYWPHTENLFENNKEHKPVYPEVIKGSLTSAEANISTILPLNSIILLGLCLKIEEISEPLLAYPFIAKCMLRLLFGAEDDGNGKPISKLGDTIIKVLPLQPYFIIKQLLDSKLDQFANQSLRDRVYQVGIIHHILHCIAIMGHHDSRNPKQDLAGSTHLSMEKSPNKTQGEVEGGKLYWEKGTGFGTGSTTSKWNLEEMVSKQKIEERHITFCLNILASYLGDCTTPETNKSEVECIYQIPDSLHDLFSYSCLLPALESYLRNDSVLDMSRHVPLYTALMGFFKKFVVVPPFIPLMLPADPTSTNCLHKHLTTMNKVVNTYLKQVAKTDKSPTKPDKPVTTPKPTPADSSLPFSSAMLQYIEQTSGGFKQDEPVDPEHLNFFLEEVQKTAALASQKVKSYKKEEQQAGKVVSKAIGTDYMSQMCPLQFASWKLVTEKNGSVSFTHPFYWSSRVQSNINNPRRARRLAQEISTLATSLPLSKSSSVFVRADEDRLDVMKVLITGPEDTPYGNGCFIFDVYFTSDYPGSPMLLQLETTGQRTIRFNPNLYNDGKVCLSILNTWHGRPEERWNSQSSSFLQVLVSVQSLILVPEPYFNEPGYEQSRGTPSGTQRSQEYNANITQATARWAILEQLRNPPPCFKKVILKHFYLKKELVLEICESWVVELKSYIKSRALSSTSTASQHLKSLQAHIKQIIIEYEKLNPKDFADSDDEDETPAEDVIKVEKTDENEDEQKEEKKDEKKDEKKVEKSEDANLSPTAPQTIN